MKLTNKQLRKAAKAYGEKFGYEWDHLGRAGKQYIRDDFRTVASFLPAPKLTSKQRSRAAAAAMDAVMDRPERLDLYDMRTWVLVADAVATAIGYGTPLDEVTE